MPVVGQKFLFAVAQQCFETGGNIFSTLVPLADLHGSPVGGRVEFPHRGLVWWMVRGTRDLVDAPPGKLIIAAIEPALRNAADKDAYQVLQPSLVHPDDFIEIIDAPELERPEAILDSLTVQMDHEPGKFVVVRSENTLYGPLIASVISENAPKPIVRFEKSLTNAIYQMPDVAGEPGYLKLSTNVCPYAAAPLEGEALRPTSYALMTGQLFAKQKERGTVIDLVTDVEVVRSVAKALMGRKAVRDFTSQFESMIESAVVPPKVLERAGELLARTSGAVEGVDSIVETVLESETLRPRIDAAVKDRVEREVESRSAKIDAQAHERIRKLTNDLAQLEDLIKQKEESQRRDLEQLEAEHRKRMEEETRLEAAKLEQARADLAAQQAMIEEVLIETIGELNSGRKSLLKDFLAIQPIIERVAGRVVSEPGLAEARNEIPSASAKGTFSLPALLMSEKLPELDEEEFFERFRTHVEMRGFVFERQDLLAYHLSVKGDSPVILGGVSGTGKSSLPRLYAEAAAGEGQETNFLPIDVNPSWTSPADLFGYPDPLERRFMPGQCGLFRELVH